MAQIQAVNGLAVGTNENDTLSGTSSNDTLIGGTGNDTLYGGLGNDIYVFNRGDGRDEISDVGADFLVQEIDSVVLVKNNDENVLKFGPNITIDNLRIREVASGITNNQGEDIYNNLIIAIDEPGVAFESLKDQITIINFISRGIGHLEFSDGSVISINEIATLKENVILGAYLNDTLIGTNGKDTLDGGVAGDDILDGGAGEDFLVGRAGNDTYVVDNAGDTVIEKLNDGIDTVKSSITYSLTANVENLTLTGVEAIDGTGNTLNNTLVGNSSNNVLIGGAGNDTLHGGLGNDTYVFNRGDGRDEIIDSNDENVLKFVSNITLNNLRIQEVASNISDNNGGYLKNLIIAIDESGVAFENLKDQITIVDYNSRGIGHLEFSDGSVVTINEIASLKENVISAGTTGDDTIIGTTAGDDILDGGVGRDTLVGKTGNDTYIVDNVGDITVENLNEGTDTVQSSITYTLSANVENLTLTGAGAINGTGNTLNNTLLGNSGNNVLNAGAGNDILDGGTGVDTLIGGAGNDTYTVDSSSDIITEKLNEGTDTVQSSVTYTLSANVENLTLTGTAIDGIGNALNNTLIGNSGNNMLFAEAGGDSITGGLGNDSLYGGSGNDKYYFNLGDGNDKIFDHSGSAYGLTGTKNAGTADSVSFGASVAKSAISLFKSGDSLVLSYGATDQITITQQFKVNNAIEKFTLADGNYLTSNDINVIIQSMNAYATDHGFAINNIDTVKNDQNLMNIVSTAWHK